MIKSKQRTVDILARIDRALLNHGARLAPERVLELVKQKQEKRERRGR